MNRNSFISPISSLRSVPQSGRVRSQNPAFRLAQPVNQVSTASQWDSTGFQWLTFGANPSEPYAYSGAMMNRAISPLFMVATPISHPLMTFSNHRNRIFWQSEGNFHAGQARLNAVNTPSELKFERIVRSAHVFAIDHVTSVVTGNYTIKNTLIRSGTLRVRTWCRIWTRPAAARCIELSRTTTRVQSVQRSGARQQR